MKKLLNLLFLILITSFLGGCMQSKTNEINNNINQGQNQTNNSTIIEKSENGNFYEGENTIQECLDTCYTMWNANQLNNNKSKEQMESQCNGICEAGQGIDKKDISFCEKSDGVMKDSCFTSIAIEKNDLELCDKIIDTTMKSSCFISIAEKNKDVKICDKILDKLWNNICIDATKD